MFYQVMCLIDAVCQRRDVMCTRLGEEEPVGGVRPCNNVAKKADVSARKPVGSEEVSFGTAAVQHICCQTLDERVCGRPFLERAAVDTEEDLASGIQVFSLFVGCRSESCEWSTTIVRTVGVYVWRWRLRPIGPGLLEIAAVGILSERDRAFRTRDVCRSVRAGQCQTHPIYDLVLPVLPS